MRTGLTYDDVLLVPQESDVSPSGAKVSVQFTKKIKLQIPILAAAMDTVTESAMAIAIAKRGGLGVLHRSNTIEEQVRMVGEIKKENLLAAAACGPHDIERAKALDNAGNDLLVIDCAHAHKRKVIRDVQKIKESIKGEIMVGNIATAQAAIALADVADVIKVGIGPGAICTTRIIAGIGVPQLTAVLDVVEALKDKEVTVVADGGLKHSGDIVKALAAGASAVMLGSMLAGVFETPGEMIIVDGEKYKAYRGMGSEVVMKKGKSSDRYFQSGARKYVPEGVEGIIRYKGKLEDVLYQIVGGIKSGMGYIGAPDIISIKEQAEFIQITNAGQKESHPHTITINKQAPNYDKI